MTIQEGKNNKEHISKFKCISTTNEVREETVIIELQIVNEIDHDADGSTLHPLPEALLLADLSVGPDPLHGQLPQLLLPVQVSGDEEVGNPLPVDVRLPHLVADEGDEPGKLVLVCGVDHHLDVLILSHLNLAGVDVLDQSAESFFVNVGDEHLAILAFLHIREHSGTEDGRP